jgi:hypothetical protein
MEKNLMQKFLTQDFDAQKDKSLWFLIKTEDFIALQ